MESKFEVETPFGPVWMWGFDTGRPLLLVLSGAFAEPWVFDQLHTAIPGVDVVRAHHPTNHCPPIRPLHLGAIGAAYAMALRTRFPDRPAVVFGNSTGALIALAMRAPQARRMVLIEPFLRTGRLWPLRLILRRRPTEEQRLFLWNLFGLTEDRLEDRDYTHLLEGLRIPTHVLVGDEPLGEPRDIAALPSLVDEQDRQALASHPFVDLTVLPGGHHFAQNIDALVSTLLRACAAVRT